MPFLAGGLELWKGEKFGERPKSAGLRYWGKERERGDDGKEGFGFDEKGKWLNRRDLCFVFV